MMDSRGLHTRRCYLYLRRYWINILLPVGQSLKKYELRTVLNYQKFLFC